MKLSWIGVGSKFNVNDALIRGKFEYRNTDSQGSKSCEEGARDWVAVMCFQAQECQGLPGNHQQIGKARRIFS